MTNPQIFSPLALLHSFGRSSRKRKPAKSRSRDAALKPSTRLLASPLLPLLLLLVAFIAAGCVQSSQRSRGTQPFPAESVPTEQGDTQTVLTDTTSTTTTLPPEGLISDIASVEVGQCFNNYRFENERTGASENLFTLIDCRRPHEGEVYHQIIHPAAPDAEYPGDRAMENWEQEECYANFEDWVGQEYVISELYFSSLRPDDQLWKDTSDPSSRRLSCYIRSADGSPLVGSHRNSRI